MKTLRSFARARILTCLFLFIATLAMPQGLNYLKAENGDIYFVDLNGPKEINFFINATKSIGDKLKLRHVVVANCPKNLKFKPFLKVLRTQAPTLKHLHFVNTTKPIHKLGDKEFLEVLKVASTADLESFYWENQKKINVKKHQDKLLAYSDFWASLEDLSFYGTELEAERFFAADIVFPNLKRLNLGHTKLKKGFPNFDQHFPVLEKLYWQGNSITKTYFTPNAASVSKTTGLGPSLPLYFLNVKNQDHSLERMKDFARIQSKYFRNLTDLFLDYRIKKRNKHLPRGTFKIWIDKQQQMTNAPPGHSELLAHFKKVSFDGYFSSNYSDIAKSEKTGQTFPNGIVFLNGQNIDRYLASGLPISDRLLLAGEQITEEDVKRIMQIPAFAEVKAIYLVNTIIYNSDLLSLYARARERQLRIHNITSTLIISDNPFDWNSSWMREQMEKQMREMMMPPKINFPR